MAISNDDTKTGAITTTTLTPTFANANIGCIVAVAGYKSGTAATCTVTANANAMNQIKAQDVSSGGYHSQSWMFQLVGVATGAKNVVITSDLTGGWVAFAVSGLNQTSPVKDSNGVNSTTSPSTATLTAADTDGICIGCSGTSSGDITGDANFTDVYMNSQFFAIEKKISSIITGQTYSVTSGAASWGLATILASFSPYVAPTVGAGAKTTWFYMKTLENIKWKFGKGLWQPNELGLTII